KPRPFYSRPSIRFVSEFGAVLYAEISLRLNAEFFGGTVPCNASIILPGINHAAAPLSGLCPDASQPIVRNFTVHPRPYTLNPTPSTLNPTPYTLNPDPYTLHPEPYTLHPQPSTLNPQPSTLNPQPSTLNAKRSTLKPKHKPSNQVSGIPEVGVRRDQAGLWLKVHANPSTLNTQPQTPNP
ncbi:hypothetical protein T484DRAFT_3636567, partial [Baffinella frigidus]